MKKFISILLLSIILFSCKSYDYPTIEESEEIIYTNSKIIDSLNVIIQNKKPKLDSKPNFVFNLSNNFINKILQSYTNSKTEDILIQFNETKAFYEENKIILGLSVRNYLDIHSSVISTDIKKVRFEKTYSNRMEALLEIESKGNILVSGRYTGIPIKANPLVELYLNEPIMFDIYPTKNGTIMFKPLPKKLLLKTRISIKVLEWYVPWYKEIPIEITELIQPIEMPLGFETEFYFPLPNSNLESNDKLTFIPYTINLENNSIRLDNDRIEFKTNLVFRKK
jgi:hypothetical protein